MNSEDNSNLPTGPVPRRPKDTSSGNLATHRTEILDENQQSSPPASESSLEELGTGSLIDARYLLAGEIGRGGMGAVYKGKHLTLQVPIAVKVMLPHVADNLDYSRRFRGEARAMSQLRHRNIAQVLDYGDVKGVPFMVMEYLDGESLGHHIAEEGLPALTDLKRIILQIIDGMDAAHKNGIIHRDLKPENIFLARESDGQEVVKVLDFGLAKLVEGSGAGGRITEVDQVAGTPHYMSPEQCRSLDVGPGTDIYALGCILTELLQGRPPFSGGAGADLLSKHLLVPAPPLDRSDQEEAIPMALERLRLDMLAKTPEARPTTMERVRTRFLDAIDGQEARRESVRPSAIGGRENRVPDWEKEAALSFGSLSQPFFSPQEVKETTVALLREEDTPDGVDEAVIFGLNLHGMKVSDVTWETGSEMDHELLVIDVGRDYSKLLHFLKTHPQRAPSTVVCGPAIISVLPQLVSAGVGDVVSYPIDSPMLARKLQRLQRDLETGELRPNRKQD